MENPSGSEIIKDWPEESQEAAQLVIDTYGEPQEATESLLTWHEVDPWKRVLASKVYFEHQFPAPHIDSVESVIDYRVPPEHVSPLAAFDGSVIVERTAGEVSARCHDEQANFLALNLMHDIVTGAKGVEEARAYYAEEFLNARRKQPTPYMEKLRFQPRVDTADPDQRVLSDQDLEKALKGGGEREREESVVTQPDPTSQPKPGYREVTADQASVLVCRRCGALTSDTESDLHDRFHLSVERPATMPSMMTRS